MTDPTTPMPPDQPANQPGIPPQPTPAPSGAAAPPPAAQPPAATLAGPPSPTPPTKRSNARAFIVGGVALVIAVCCGGIGIAALSNDEGEPVGAASSATPSITTAAPTSAAPTTAAPTSAPASTAPALPIYGEPTKSDFKLKVKILRKQCFGSAGCNVTYRIDVTYTGDNDLDPSKTYEVTYQVKGAEDPIINTFEVTGDTASLQDEEMASTKRSTDKLTAVVTDVSEY